MEKTKYDLYSDAFRATTHETYAAMREHDPILRQAGLDGETPIWFLTRYEDVVAMLLDDERFVLDPALALTPEELEAQPSPIPPELNELIKPARPHDGRRRPSPPAPSRREGIHAEDGRAAAPAHPGDRRRAHRRHRGERRGGPRRQLRLPTPDHRHRRAPRDPGSGPRPVPRVVEHLRQPFAGRGRARRVPRAHAAVSHVPHAALRDADAPTPPTTS